MLRRIPHWPDRPAGPADGPLAAPERLQVIRGYLRLLGPATVKDVAGFLDAPVAEVKAHWPAEAVEVEVAGHRAWRWPTEDPPAAPTDLVRLLGPFDPWLQARDRDLVVPDRSRHKALWPTIGRPGAVLAGTEVVGSWRPRASGRRLTITVQPWQPWPRAVRTAVQDEAARLAAHRGVTLTEVAES